MPSSRNGGANLQHFRETPCQKRKLFSANGLFCDIYGSICHLSCLP